MERHHSQGLTLVELLIVISVLGLLITIGVPAMTSLIDTSRLRAAAGALASRFHYARTETIAHPDGTAQVYVSFRRNPENPRDWCYGLSRGGPCDCRIDDVTNAAACRLNGAGAPRLLRTTSADYPGVALEHIAFGADGHTHFDAVRGTARSGHVRFRNGRGLKIILSPLGRVRQCVTDGGTLPGYAPC